MKDIVNRLCVQLNSTYNTYVLLQHPRILDMFYQAIDIYDQNPEKYPNINTTFTSLIYNLVNNEKTPIADYISGPSEVSRWDSTEHNKIVYLFGENHHSNVESCLSFNNQKLIGVIDNHMNIENYLLKLFKYSPVFIDFYVELGIDLDRTTQPMSYMLSLIHI